MIDKKLLKKAILIRQFEEKLLELFSIGKLTGTAHTCVGEEWIGVAICDKLNDNDLIFSNHRCHGHYISATMDINGLMAEINGKNSGPCCGIGGSQHICASNRFFSNGIQGGMTPIAAGAAYSFKLRNIDNISVAFIGDGTFGEGILYETLNIVSLWNIPVLYVVENNGYAQSTKISQSLSGSIESRIKSFDIKYFKTNTFNIEKLFKDTEDAINYCRKNKKPVVIEIETYRLMPHSKGEDNRDKTEIENYKKIDYINIFSQEHVSEYQEIITENNEIINKAVDFAIASPISNYIPTNIMHDNVCLWKDTINTSKDRERHYQLINKAINEQFDSNGNIFMLGEDIEDPYGGAFKISKNISSKHPNKIKNTPISEAAIAGVATGLALNGTLSIVEIMFGDFSTLIFDQVMQHMTKFNDMYSKKCNVPVIIRTPMGGKRGYGPTHSQSIEKFFMGIYGLDIIAINNRISPDITYKTLFNNIKNPTFVIENKILYTKILNKENINGFSIQQSNELYPTIKISPLKSKPDITIVCYGGMLEEAEKVLLQAFEKYEILCEIICPTQLQPLNIYPIKESINKTHKLITIEEGPNINGFGSEVISRLHDCNINSFICKRIGYNGIIPSSLPQEINLLPSSESILNSIKEINDNI